MSNDTLRRMVRVADRHSYGSKITGAGGGGCIVAIADPSNAAATAAALAGEGYRTFEAQIGGGAHSGKYFIIGAGRPIAHDFAKDGRLGDYGQVRTPLLPEGRGGGPGREPCPRWPSPSP